MEETTDSSDYSVSGNNAGNTPKPQGSVVSGFRIHWNLGIHLSWITSYNCPE